MVPYQDPEARRWYGLFREAAVVPKISTREPVSLGRKSPLDETWHLQEAASLFRFVYPLVQPL